MEKFEVRETPYGGFGIWNNDMLAFQYIPEWEGTSVEDLAVAMLECLKRNR